MAVVLMAYSHSQDERIVLFYRTNSLKVARPLADITRPEYAGQ